MPIYTLWEMLSGAVLVFADEATQTLITWNESMTYNVYTPVYTPQGADFAEVTAFTASGTVNYEHAKAIAAEWHEANAYS